MKVVIKKIGGSKFLLVPHEYIEVFNLLNYEYTFTMSEDGTTLMYKKTLEIPKEISSELAE